METRVAVIKGQGGSYILEFETDDGTLRGKVDVALGEGADGRSQHEKRQAAGAKIKVLTEALARAGNAVCACCPIWRASPPLTADHRVFGSCSGRSVNGTGSAYGTDWTVATGARASFAWAGASFASCCRSRSIT